MRAQHLFVGGLALLLGACSWGKGGQAPPPLDKELLPGKWENASKIQFIAGYVFGEDGSVKMTVRGMKQPVPIRYTWSGERTIELEYPASADVRRAYKAAAKAYKDDVQESVKAKKLDSKAGASLSSVTRDELPVKETLQVAITEQPGKPPVLFVTDERGVQLMLGKAD